MRNAFFSVMLAACGLLQIALLATAF